MNQVLEKPKIKELKEILISPIITHKSTILAQSKCYTFLVKRNFNKDQIAEAFEKIFGAKVLRINTTVKRSKNRRTKKGYRMSADLKKAYIQTDKELDIFPKL